MEAVELLRPEDLLTARLELVNLALTVDGAEPALVRVDAAQPSSVLLVLPPQHYREPIGSRDVSVPAPLFAARPTVLELLVPDGVAALPVPAAGLLDLLDGLEVSGSRPVIVPARVHLLPVDARWQFAAPPARHRGRTALWRARLLAGPHEGRVTSRFRLGGLDDAAAHDPGFDVTPSTARLFSDFLHGTFEVARCDLSALGASLRLRGPLPPPEAEVVTPRRPSWEQDVDFGRDSRVQILSHGHLSSGHRATLVDVTRRRFDVLAPPGSIDDVQPAPLDTPAVAWLDRDLRIVVDDPVVALAQMAAALPSGGRDVPFTALRMVSLTTPRLSVPAQADQAFWVQADDGRDVVFDLVATDRDGVRVDLRMPLLYIPEGAAADPGAVVRAHATAPASRRHVATGAQRVAFASSGTGAFSAPVDQLELGLAAQPHADPTGPPVLPVLQAAHVVVDAATQLTGQRHVGRATLHPLLLAGGVDRERNPLGAFLRLDAALPLALAARDVGGLAEPSMLVQSLTGGKGAVPAAFDSGTPPTPEQLAAQLPDARLLGTIALRDVIDLAGTRVDAPELTRRLVGTDLVLRYHWTVPLRGDNGTPLEPAAGTPSGASRLELTAEVVRAAAGGGAVRSSVHGTLHQVDVVIGGVVRVHFDRLEVIAEHGAKTRVVPGGMRVQFLGALAFVGDLVAALEQAGLAGGSAVEVTPTGVSAGFGAALPAVQVGMFSLSNLAVDARLRIPFDGQPASFRFAIADRARPFSVAVSLFGGGGFFALELDTAGRRTVEAALEFGGAVSLDLVVASGGVSVMGGIYFRMEGDAVTIAGYLRCGGYLSVLGLVTVSVEFLMQLTYQEATGKVAGAASLTIGIEVLFFSKTITLSVERQFAGSGGDPSFTDCVEPEDWEEYCGAFA